MNPNQALLEALQSQRNNALDNAAMQHAQIVQLRAEIDGLKVELAEAKKPKKIHRKVARKAGGAKLKP